MENVKSKNTLRDYFALGEMGRYFFRKKGEGPRPSFSLRMMHGINKFSIVVFLMAVVFWVIKRLFIS